jgi:hypothetical protein
MPELRRKGEEIMTWIAYMTQSGKDVILKIGTREECQTAIDAVSGTPGITKIGMKREREGKHE